MLWQPIVDSMCVASVVASLISIVIKPTATRILKLSRQQFAIVFGVLLLFTALLTGIALGYRHDSDVARVSRDIVRCAREHEFVTIDEIRMHFLEEDRPVVQDALKMLCHSGQLVVRPIQFTDRLGADHGLQIYSVPIGYQTDGSSLNSTTPRGAPPGY